MAAVEKTAPVRAASPGRRSATPTGSSGKLGETNAYNGPMSRHVNGFPPVVGFPGLYETAKAPNPAGLTPPPPPSHYFNGLPGIGYSTPSLANLQHYLVAAQLGQSLARGAPLANGSPLYGKELDPLAAADLERKRRRTDSGIEDSAKSLAADAKPPPYRDGHQSPAEMETVKKMLETVNASVTRQLLEASVQRAKSAQFAPPASPPEKQDYSEGKIGTLTCRRHCELLRFVSNATGLAAKLENETRRARSSPSVTPGLEDMMEEVPDEQQQANQGSADEEHRDDAASETGTDDSGLVMALEQDALNGQRDDNNSSANQSSHSNSSGHGPTSAPGAKTTERTRSTISEDKAAVS